MNTIRKIASRNVASKTAPRVRIMPLSIGQGDQHSTHHEQEGYENGDG
jgi:hypothetical protein